MIKRKLITLTNSQIIALPTTPITLVSAQGSDTLIEPVLATVYCKSSGGAYATINAAGSLGVGWNNAGSITDVLGYVPNDAGITYGSTTRLTDLLGSTAVRRAVLLPLQQTEGTNQWGLMSFVVSDPTNLTNKDLVIYIDNSGSGVLTGGNAANTLVVNLWYSVVLL